MDQLLMCLHLKKKKWICKLKIVDVKKITCLNELHARQENMTLSELKDVIREIYPGQNNELFAISYELLI